jgi:hypothetical protein
MALLWADPCGAFYSTVAQAESGIYSTLAATIVTSGLPSGLTGTAFQNLSTLIFQVPNTSGPYYFGCRYLIPTAIGSAQNIFSFLDGSGQPQITFQTNTNGTIMAKRGTGNGTLLGTSSALTPLIQNVASYIEFGGTCSATVGTVNVFINGTSVLALTGQNTQGQGGVIIGAVNLLGAGNTNYVQDIYVADSTGTYNNSFLGEIDCTVSRVAGTGTAGLNQYTANGAATVWQSVNAVTPTDSTVYASDATASDRMSSTITPVTAPFIAGVIHVSRMEKSDSGTRTAAQTITSNGVDSVSSTISPGTSYGYHIQPSQTDPNTNLPYTNSGFNALQIGVKTVS